MSFREFLKRSAAAAAIATLAFSGVANAEVLARLGGAWMSPVEDTLPSGTGEELEWDGDSPVISGDVTWKFTEHLGVEFWINYKWNSGIHFNDAAGNSTGIGEVEMSVPMVSLQWHFMHDSWFRPYVGGGLAFPTLDSSNSDFIDLDNDTGWQVGAGIDMGAGDPLYRGFFANLFIKYADFNTKTSLDNGGTVIIGNWDASPLIYGIGVGYRFGSE